MQGEEAFGTAALFDAPSAPEEPPALGAVVAAGRAPVARVLLETPVPHLDRPFDYLVPAELDDAARAGVRVRVPFSGRRLTGYLLERVDHPEPGVRPVPLTGVVSPEVVLAPEVVGLARAVAARYAGTVADVVRAAVPPRVARVEKEEADEPVAAPARPAPGAWACDDGGGDFLDRLAQEPAGAPARAVVSVCPDGGAGWAARLAVAAATTLSAGRGAVIVVPDARDLELLCEALDELLPEGGYARLAADDGPTPRYRNFLALSRGTVRLAVGTRAAAFAPVRDLGLVAMWDDHDASHQEPRAPYHHAREVLLLRADAAGAHALFASPARSAEAQRLVTSGWAHEITTPRSLLRNAAPWVRASSDGYEAERDPLLHAARVPHLAWEVAKRALVDGPVLVQVARTGFLPALRCERCREPARCRHCAGPLALSRAQADPVCRWCGRYDRSFECQQCHGRVLRAASVGADRTAEELGRAFAGVPVVRSTGADGVRRVGAEPALVVATPGAEPIAAGGYAAVLLLDADAQLAPEGLRVGEDAVHRWFAAASLARSRADGGVVVLTGHPSLQGQGLVRWDPAGVAERELAERAQAGLPPAVRSAVLTGPAAATDSFAEDIVAAAPGVRAIGPTPGEEPGEHRWILFFDHAHGPRVTDLLRRRKGLGSLRKDPVVSVRVDDPRAL